MYSFHDVIIFLRGSLSEYGIVNVFRMDTWAQLAFMECISMLAIARMIMNACIAFSIWHVETEYRMIQASPIHLHY